MAAAACLHMQYGDEITRASTLLIDDEIDNIDAALTEGVRFRVLVFFPNFG